MHQTQKSYSQAVSFQTLQHVFRTQSDIVYIYFVQRFCAYFMFFHQFHNYSFPLAISLILFFSWDIADVPEGSFIIREHSPMSNLFSCLWFNEVDRFTSRDQLSFAYTYMKLVRTNPGKRFYLNMFKVNFSSLLLWQLFKLGNFTRIRVELVGYLLEYP